MPTAAGTSKVLRVRSGLICFQLCPPSRVAHSVLAAKYIRCGSSGEKTIGSVRITRKSGRAQRHRHDVLRLAGAAVVARELAAIDDVGIERIGHHVAVLFRRHRMPVAKGDLAVVAAAGDAHRAALLLAAAQPIGEGVVGIDVIELRRGLVVPRAPGLRRR